jgi:Sec-independent protein translocase protein TatA
VPNEVRDASLSLGKTKKDARQDNKKKDAQQDNKKDAQQDKKGHLARQSKGTFLNTPKTDCKTSGF